MTFLEVTDIQHGCTHDGPGLRTTVFLKSCPLRCRWCHNPETQRMEKELYYRPERCIACGACAKTCPENAHSIEDGAHWFDKDACVDCMKCTQACPSGALESVSRTMTVEEIMGRVRQDRVFYRRRGGLTVSGGEPTAQKGVLELLKQAKSEGISTCMETCGVFPSAMVPQLLETVDLFLYDIKDTNAPRLREHTGADAELVLKNLRAIDEGGGKTVLRCVLVPEVNLEPAYARAVAELFHSLRGCGYVELLPYHPYGLSKSEQLGREGVQYRQPEKAELDEFAGVLLEAGVPVKLHGTMLE